MYDERAGLKRSLFKLWLIITVVGFAFWHSHFLRSLQNELIRANLLALSHRTGFVQSVNLNPLEGLYASISVTVNPQLNAQVPFLCGNSFSEASRGICWAELNEFKTTIEENAFTGLPIDRYDIVGKSDTEIVAYQFEAVGLWQQSSLLAKLVILIKVILVYLRGPIVVLILGAMMFLLPAFREKTR